MSRMKRAMHRSAELPSDLPAACAAAREQWPDAAHTADCPACRAWFAAVDRLDVAVVQRPAPEPPFGLSERIVRVVRRDRRQRQARRWLVGSALAASVAFAVFWLNRPEQSVNVATATVPPPSLQASLSDTGNALAALTRRAAGTLEPTLTFLPANAELPRPAWPTLTAASKQLDDLRQGGGAGLEPLANPARRAIGMLRAHLFAERPGT